ncbi:hypothetical protein DPMN_127668 [Dreissena polymorpha]|uniref:Secreted protein n=1 Tax=Dreissena polymorpha TaxID=45954 RepID=A0A9D4GZE0_DREPO|nr:hypothetical protein DPMN_127668 [Dreissena polymorpha]
MSKHVCKILRLLAAILLGTRPGCFWDSGSEFRTGICNSGRPVVTGSERMDVRSLDCYGGWRLGRGLVCGRAVSGMGSACWKMVGSARWELKRN